MQHIWSQKILYLAWQLKNNGYVQNELTYHIDLRQITLYERSFQMTANLLWINIRKRMEKMIWSNHTVTYELLTALHLSMVQCSSEWFRIDRKSEMIVSRKRSNGFWSNVERLTDLVPYLQPSLCFLHKTLWHDFIQSWRYFLYTK